MSIDMAQFHQVFFEESFEGLDIMESGLLGMQPGEADSEEINAIFRAAHSIKGGAGTFGFTDISNFTHIMETLLDEMRDGRRDVTAEAIEVLLKSVDILRHMMTATQDGDDVDLDVVKSQHAELERILASDGSAAAEQTSSQVSAAEAAGQGDEIIGWKIVFNPHDTILRSGNDPYRIIRELAELGEVEVLCDTDQLPDLKDFDVENYHLSW